MSHMFTNDCYLIRLNAQTLDTRKLLTCLLCFVFV